MEITFDYEMAIVNSRNWGIALLPYFIIDKTVVASQNKDKPKLSLFFGWLFWSFELSMSRKN